MNIRLEMIEQGQQSRGRGTFRGREDQPKHRLQNSNDRNTRYQHPTILLHIETKAYHQYFSLLISCQDVSLLISGQDIIHQQLINRPHVIDVDGRDTWR